MALEIALGLLSRAVWLMISFACVLILPSLIVGLVIAIFQGATQINEQTMSFLPRLITSLLMVIFAGSWIFTKLSDFFNYLFINIPNLIG